ncbi:hypothetical protein HCY84_00910 [Limosilactobacillus fermentum]
MNKRVVAFIVGMVAVLAVIVLGNLARSGATPSTNSSNQATKQPVPPRRWRPAKA